MPAPNPQDSVPHITDTTEQDVPTADTVQDSALPASEPPADHSTATALPSAETTADALSVPLPEADAVVPPPRAYLRPCLLSLLTLLGATIFVNFTLSHTELDSPSLSLLLGLLPLQFMGAGVLLLALLPVCQRGHFAEAIHWHPDTPPQHALFRQTLTLLIPMMFISAAVSIGVSLLYSLLGEESTPQPVVSMLAQYSENIPFLLLSVLAILVIAPLGEELFFRLGIHTTLCSVFPGHVANFGTALLFALVHGHAQSMPGLFIIGLFLQYAKTIGGLRQSIALHAAYNGTQLLFILLLNYLQPGALTS